jgi:hypothetical protein
MRYYWFATDRVTGWKTEEFDLHFPWDQHSFLFYVAETDSVAHLASYLIVTGPISKESKAAEARM